MEEVIDPLVKPGTPDGFDRAITALATMEAAFPKPEPKADAKPEPKKAAEPTPAE
ncbi:MAG TPA: hypothetical protein VHC22_34205 [Pirellulales bacterium]|nr:hypothetical protein [Pirellulales bacterium]